MSYLIPEVLYYCTKWVPCFLQSRQYPKCIRTNAPHYINTVILRHAEDRITVRVVRHVHVEWTLRRPVRSKPCRVRTIGTIYISKRQTTKYDNLDYFQRRDIRHVCNLA